MLITKTLYREFMECPKYSWYHVNKPESYRYIQDTLYWSEDSDEEASESDEKQVEKLFLWRFSIPRITDLSEYWVHSNVLHDKTMEAIKNKEHIIYQGWLIFKNVFTIFDILKYDETSNTYALLEIKSKNSVRNSTNTAMLKAEILHDISIQNYVLEQYITISDVQIGYLNKSYKKDWAIDIFSITKIESVRWEMQETKEIENIVETMTQVLELSEPEFDKRIPYQADKTLLYFWSKDPSRNEGSIFSIPRITQAKIWEKGSKFHAVTQWYENQIVKIEDIPLEDYDQLTDTYRLFISKYKAGDSIDKETVRNLLWDLEFPLYFYDYETISVPIPLMNWTWPWEQIVCQYSLHRLDSLDALEYPENIAHFEWLIDSGSTNNRDLIAKFIQDIGNPKIGTFIVWHKSFECGRNEEIMEAFPEFTEQYTYINSNTFDLKDIVSSSNRYAYFLRKFCWSASIKYVLPAMSDLSYDWMAVSNWKIAMEAIRKLLLIDDSMSRSNLLAYCKQDTFAMVKIFEKLNTLISS